MAPNDTPDPTVAAIQTVLREEAVSSPNMDADTLAGRIADGLPASQAAKSDASDALDRANERIAELTATCAEHVSEIDRLTDEHAKLTKRHEALMAEHNAGPGGDVEQTGPGQTDKATGNQPAIGGVEPK